MNSVRTLAALFAVGATIWGATGCNADSYGQPAAPVGPSVSDNPQGPFAAEDAGSAADVSPAIPIFGPPPAGAEGGFAIGPASLLDAGVHPSFGATVTAATTPPAISGGTLLVLHDGNTAVAADPDRDSVYVVDVSGAAVTHTVALAAGDEPGRLVEDGAGRVHVALRSGGALVTIDPRAGTVIARRTVCPAPRGVAWDRVTDLVWVACATGELAGLPAAGGPATVNRVVERDLRDVLIDNGTLTVTKFRSAELLRLASDGTIARRDAMPLGPAAEPHVLWRAVQGPSGKVVSVHQEHSKIPLPTHIPGGYTGKLPAVSDRCTTTDPDGVNQSIDIVSDVPSPPFGPSMGAVLPVDLALSAQGTFAVVVAAGNAFVPDLPNLFVVGLGAPTDGGAAPTESWPDGTTGQRQGARAFFKSTPKQPIAVALDAHGRVLVQTREPATLWVSAPPPASRSSGNSTLAGTEIVLSAASRADTGHEIFHTAAGVFLACASCHPEGGDDGHVWLLDGQPRRTPSLRGTIAGTAPYHWPGDEADLVALANDVYSGRMSGAKLDSAQMAALTGWIEKVPAPPAPTWVDPAAAQRGRALFERADTACATCHSGAKFTNNTTI
ncbi:MAG TPA: hypothetical protein VGY54_12075, partial [Polyangiaceae bacterium]|nr:hypothetical protein [Polyangiaceae bacterium]